jgi:hypothetical protein
MAWNAGVSLVSGFYGGEIPLSAAQTERFHSIKKRPWSALVPVLTGRGDPQTDGRTRITFLYWLVAKSAGSLLVMFGMAGVVLAVWRGVGSPLMFLLAATIVYQWLLFMLLSTEPRYKNGLYLYFVLFILLAWQKAAKPWRAWHTTPARRSARGVPIADAMRDGDPGDRVARRLLFHVGGQACFSDLVVSAVCARAPTTSKRGEEEQPGSHIPW